MIEDVVYLMTKSLFDHLDLLVQTHPAAKDIDVDKAPFGLRVSLHPGAEMHYREFGLVKQGQYDDGRNARRSDLTAAVAGSAALRIVQVRSRTERTAAPCVYRHQ